MFRVSDKNRMGFGTDWTSGPTTGMSARSRVLLGASVLALSAVTWAPKVDAGGFAVREQSARFQGSSFAGSAAGLDLSSMFWNPAAVTTRKGMNSEAHGAAILGSTRLTNGTSNSATYNTLNAGLSNESGNIASPALVTSSYMNYQINDQLFLGLSVNAPFGLTTKPDNPWNGQQLGFTSRLLTFNAAPTVGYKLMPGLSVAAGVQVQYITTRLTTQADTIFVAPGPPPVTANAGTVAVEGDDIGVGWTLGALYQPSSWTTIGLGFRSSISHTLEGDQRSSLGNSDITAGVDLPEIVTFSFAQNLTQNFKVLGTVEWTNWSRVKSIPIECDAAGGLCTGSGAELSSLDLNYDDGWFFSLGLEYAYTPATTLRGGFAYEISPATSDTSRTVRLPDNDRYWFSAGLSHALTPTMHLDLGYTYILVKDGGISQEIPASSGGGTYTADAESHVNILTAGLKMKLH
ncbi:MAG: outer membrane protein transport protein [Pseudomonadota bacterium]